MHSLPLVRTTVPLLLFLLGAACDRGGAPGEGGAASAAAPIDGMYEVAGTTVETATGERREISGTVILSEDGNRYTATYSLQTAFHAGASVLPTEVIGSGSGEIDGRTLRGTAETQLVIATVPGIDPGFAFIPRTTTTRIVSNSNTTIAPDGSVFIEIENQPAAGETYAPSRTTLRGARIGGRISGSGAPPVAAVNE